MRHDFHRSFYRRIQFVSYPGITVSEECICSFAVVWAGMIPGRCRLWIPERDLEMYRYRVRDRYVNTSSHISELVCFFLCSPILVLWQAESFINITLFRIKILERNWQNINICT